MRVLFFCSSFAGIAPEYNEAARRLVRAAASRGYEIASGGTVKGTMGVICDEAAACGAVVRGVLPRFMEPLAHPKLTDVEWTDTMSERKEAMRKGVDIAIALPGGIGTMDELFETLVLAKLDRFPGRIAALNIDGFYDPLDALLAHFVETGMLAPEERARLLLPKTVEEAIELL
ncbi:MAG: TIGR00730 family Rossman fold protein [Bacteroidales bacterium]|nr:TIGR00730 family Rossman fold protein [Bacteroidales bacterium]